MSTLTMVRHGQASFFSSDYDKLSEHGMRQCRALGDYWVTHARAFDRAFVGPRVRHRESGAQVAAAFADAGMAFPDLEMLDEKDEFQWEAIVAHAIEHVVPGDPRLQALHDAMERADDPHERRRTFERLYQAVTLRWVRGEIAHEDVESWSKFAARVNRSIDGMVATAPRGSRYVAFTSGGPAAVAVGRALGLTPEKTLGLVMTLRNASLVEFWFSGDRFSLSAYNDLPHLPNPSDWTYR